MVPYPLNPIYRGIRKGNRTPDPTENEKAYKTKDIMLCADNGALTLPTPNRRKNRTDALIKISLEFHNLNPLFKFDEAPITKPCTGLLHPAKAGLSEPVSAPLYVKKIFSFRF